MSPGEYLFLFNAILKGESFKAIGFSINFGVNLSCTYYFFLAVLVVIVMKEG